MAAAALSVSAHAQSTGVTTQGVTGGLVVPSAAVLETGTAAVTFGNYQEPQLGAFSRRRNMSLGFGLLPEFELFGRFAEYQNPLPGSSFVNGPRDISANAKLRLPRFWRDQPQLAVGMNDIRGGAVYFRSAYGVASDRWGFFHWSVGYAKGSSAAGAGKAFDGLFGGVEALLGNTGLSVLAEHDGQLRHAGLRFQVPAPAASKFSATLQRSFGAERVSPTRDRTTLALSLQVPLDYPATRLRERAAPSVAEMPPAGWTTAGGRMLSREDRLEAICRLLASLGLERVRAGVQGDTLLVEHENNLFLQNEADAIGIVLGVAAEYAPAGIRRVSAVTLKSGTRVYETSVGVSEFQEFLRHGDPAHARTSLATDVLERDLPEQVQWLDARATPHRRVRFEISPEFDYALATELAPFEYSLAVAAKAVVPLWTGADLQVTAVQPVTNTENLERGFAFENILHRRGVRTASFNQSGWLGPHLHASLGAGLYKYNRAGFQWQGIAFAPRGDQIHLRVGGYERRPGESGRRTFEAAALYRYAHSPSLVIEGGVQQYTDGTGGPSLQLTRWFGDVSLAVFYRRGGIRQYAGVEFSIPLTPRRGAAIGSVASVAGTPRFTRSVRTRLVDDRTSTNTFAFNAVREMRLENSLDVMHLNSGRISERYYITQLPRMREAFLIYARPALPQ